MSCACIKADQPPLFTAAACGGGIIPLLSGAILVYDHRLIIRVPGIEPEQMHQAREKGGILPPNYLKGISRLPFPDLTNTNICPYPLYMVYLYLLCKRENLPVYIRLSFHTK